MATRSRTGAAGVARDATNAGVLAAMDLNAAAALTTPSAATSSPSSSAQPRRQQQPQRQPPPQQQQQRQQQQQQQQQLQHPLDYAKGLHGCKHYRRRCKLVAPCCDEAFWCRHCHNERTAAGEWDPRRRHELERSAVREVVCGLCDERQPAAASCRRCGVGFGDYVCLRCCFFDDVDRGQWHCDACGICRVGGAHRFFHCETCSCCYSTSLRGNHVCVENSMRSACPVCLEYLFDSVRPTAVLPCGHTIHSECLRECERQRQLSCPVCLRSYADLGALWRRLDAEVAATRMPEEYRRWRVSISCNDCSGEGVVAFHVLGLKCPSCSSYNTRRLGIDRGEEEEGGGAGGGGGAGAAGEGGAGGGERVEGARG